MKFINRRRLFYTVGLDIFKPYLREAKRKRTHDDYILCDVKKMPIRSKSFDVVLCIEVLEHLRREDGIKLIRDMEDIACKQVIISTPVKMCMQHAYDGNPYQKHKYVWDVDEMRGLGYTVKGVGLQGIPGEEGVAYRVPKLLRPALHIIWILTGLFSCNKPSYAGHMVCVKEVGGLHRRISIINIMERPL